MTIREYISKKKPIHIIGIGGVSMSALAELLLSLGVPVTGSDKSHSKVTERLERLGAKITYAHLAENVENTALVVRTAAVHDDNPEIISAREKNIPVMERAEAWGNLMTDYKNVVCMSGTHGKTTTTSMMTLIAMQANADPTVMVGSHLPAINGTLRIGGKDCFVAESCEYCNSFLNFAPTIAVILSIEADHLDFFKDLDDIIHSFHMFALRTPKDGAVIVNGDDKNAMKAVEGVDRKIITFGLNKDCNVYAENITSKNGYYSFDIIINGEKYTNVTLSVPGKHNMLNALAAVAAAYELNIPSDKVAEGLEKFTGSSRRFQKIGTLKCGAVVVDDYAHHPSEMRATLETARLMDFNRIICAFQPHTYTRTKSLFNEFVDALKMCDKAILAPIYAAREQNTIGIYSSDIAKEVEGAIALDTFEQIEDYLRENAKAGDLIITMGAGNINSIGYALVEKDCKSDA